MIGMMKELNIAVNLPIMLTRKVIGKKLLDCGIDHMIVSKIEIFLMRQDGTKTLKDVLPALIREIKLGDLLVIPTKNVVIDLLEFNTDGETIKNTFSEFDVILDLDNDKEYSILDILGTNPEAILQLVINTDFQNKMKELL